MTRQQVKIQHNQDQMASGKRVLTAGDDPLASINIQNFKQYKVQIEQYLEAITLARNRQNLAETAISQAETLIDNAKNTGLKMVNGALSSSDRQAYQQALKALLGQFLDLANTKDESGNFIFSGTQLNTQPFFRDGAGNVSYVGDDFHRTAQIAPAVEVQTSDPGNKVFMQMKNPFGDYEPKYALAEKSSLLLSQATNSDKADNARYRVRFSTDTLGKLSYQLFQNDKLVATDTYNPKTGIEWQSLTLRFQGDIQPSDEVSLQLQAHFSLFNEFKRGIDFVAKNGSKSTTAAELQQFISKLSAAFIHMSQMRSVVGNRLNTMDRQEEMHLDYQVVLSRSLSSLEDLDYSKAVIELNENMLALKSSQQAFALVKDLNLFNYI